MGSSAIRRAPLPVRGVRALHFLKRRLITLLAVAIFTAAPCLVTSAAEQKAAAEKPRPPSEDSGGELIAEQAAYDVRHVNLDLQVFPSRKSIAGTASLEVRATAPLTWLVLDLNPRLKVSRIRTAVGDAATAAALPARFERRGPRLWIELGRAVPVGTRVVAAIDYAGRPREAKRAPWDGGFTWAKTKDGQPWIATACETEGADLWWPCKDHPSDRPESFALRIRVPEPLVVAANGRLVDVLSHPDHTRTYHWHTDYPINNYNIALNIAPYTTITRDYTSVTGEAIPVTYWVLPENREAGEKFMPEILAHLNFYERVLGPYPFRREKYGVVETPHLGMEHQSIIAYGNKYRGGPHGYDWLHHHELGHEWWGNLVCVSDWRDFWIHEGLCTYMQPLYAEEREGIVAYHHAMYENRRKVENKYTLVPDAPTSQQVMDKQLGSEVYTKGAWVVHMLRYLIGREHTLAVLRRFAYPTPELERAGDGSAPRFVTTDDFIRTAEEVSGRDLGWFFRLYLKQPKLPALVARIDGDKLRLRWDTPDGFSFPMPVEVEVDGRVERIEMPDGQAELDAARYARAKLDPQMWILKQPRAVDVSPPGLLIPPPTS